MHAKPMVLKLASLVFFASMGQARSGGQRIRARTESDGRHACDSQLGGQLNLTLCLFLHFD